VSWFVMAYSAAGRGSLSACTSPPPSVAPRPTLRRLRLGGGSCDIAGWRRGRGRASMPGGLAATDGGRLSLRLQQA
jgi:hypothetical protein